MDHILSDIDLGMPQLGPVGLSENWLLRHFGDVHWGLICKGLGTPSVAIANAQGERLYASFARGKWRASDTLNGFGESDVLRGRISMHRNGDSVYTSMTNLYCSDKLIEIRLLSKFSSRVKEYSNNLLRSSAPAMPMIGDIPHQDEISEFLSDHRKLRTRKPFTEAFIWSANCAFKYVYEPVGYFEFNGANLLYFASYPVICNIAVSRYVEEARLCKRKDWIIRHSPVSKDIFYFANCDIGDSIIAEIRFLAFEPNGQTRTVVDLRRLSDDAWMARIYAEYCASRF
jgi:probable biosynthetic protein (TIGR04098 family)